MFAEWRDGVDGYCISNENKMATCCKDVEKPLGLYSTGQLYTCGHSVAFRIVDVGQACASDGIALTVAERESEPLNRPGSVFVSVSGESTDGQTSDHLNTIQYNTIQYNTIQYNTIQYNTIQYNTIQYNTIQYNTIKLYCPGQGN